MTTPTLTALLHETCTEYGLGFHDAGDPAQECGILAARLIAAGVRVTGDARPGTCECGPVCAACGRLRVTGDAGLDAGRWARAQARVIATTSYDANHVRVLSDAVAREYREYAALAAIEERK